MDIHPLHSWDLTLDKAIVLQRELASRVVLGPPLHRPCRLVAGADVSYNRFSNVLHAGVVVFETRDWTIVERQGAVLEVKFPYRTGLLSFREAPVLLEALAKIESAPDVLVIDGQGIAHPRRLGLASHVGLWLERPCVGCAKSRLWGHFGELGREAGSTAPLTQKDEVLGKVVRTKTGVQPVFVSAGHKIDLASAVAVVQAAVRGYRIPEPTRQAHLYVNGLRQAANRGEAF